MNIKDCIKQQNVSYEMAGETMIVSGNYLDLRNNQITSLEGFTFSGNNLYLGRHAINLESFPKIKIGCEVHSIGQWISNYNDIGKKYDYSKREIELYGMFLTWVKNNYKAKQVMPANENDKRK